MASLLPPRLPYVCRACRTAQSTRALVKCFTTTTYRRSSLREQLSQRESRTTNGTKDQASRSFKRSQLSASRTSPNTRDVTPTKRINRQTSPDLPPQNAIVSSIERDPRNALREIQINALDILGSDRIPEDAVVRELFAQAQTLATTLQNIQFGDIQHSQSAPQAESKSSLLSDLAESSQRNTSTSVITQNDRNNISQNLAKTLYTLSEDPKVYLSESLLTAYVTTITTLGLPQYLPKVFNLYATKAIPRPGSYPIKYSEPWSRAPKYAIPVKLVDMAIQSAVAAKDMPLCISIIDTTVATPQYKAAKFLRKALPPLVGASSIIPLSYAAAQSAAAAQVSWDPHMFFWMCMSGATAYLGTMGTLLFITVTTWNDHHRRVRWVPGTPFMKRWLGEEERALFDRIAMEWGYEDEGRWGEETGEEWEALREVLGLRYMEVDRSSLLPGML